MLRAAPRIVPRSVPRTAPRSMRGYAHHAEHHAEQIVAEGNPTKEWLQQRHDVEHHAGGICIFLQMRWTDFELPCCRDDRPLDEDQVCRLVQGK